MSKLRIVVADDDPIIRLDLKQMLQSMEYEVVGEAGDGREAVAVAESLRPDICVLDIKMPIMDGIEVVRHLVENEIAPAILLTAYSDRVLIDRAKQAGAFAYLVKPFKPGDLPPAIEVAVTRYRQWLEVNKEVTDLTERLESRKAIEKAKAILMAKQSLSESEAFRRIQQSSMNSRKSMREIAEAVILSEEL